MTQRADRITCPRCGANNFDTQAACWKCNTALGAPNILVNANPAPMQNTSPYAMPTVQERSVDKSLERPSSGTSSVYAPQYPVPVSAVGDNGVARRAAIALALTIPFIGLPVGWIFMMIEDPKRQAIGRVCAVWSMIGLVLHLFLMFLGAQAMGGMLLRLLPIIEKSMPGGGGMPSGGSLPGGSDSVP